MKNLIIPILGLMLFACGSGPKPAAGENQPAAEVKKETDEEKGIGKYDHVDVGPGINTEMAKAGSTLYDLKCLSCHKLTDEKVVGPGWKGVTTRRKPEWIMNFLTNIDEMIDKDPEAQAMLEVCMVRMPNQNLSETDARNALEFMRQNDGVK
jgi:cytochrome c551/c552